MGIDSKSWLKLISGSDIWGREDQLTDEFCARTGYAFACMLARRMETAPDRLTIAVGRDDRESSRRIQAALIRGVTAADSDVLDGGACAAPALFMTVARRNESTGGAADGAMMVTVDSGLPAIRFLTVQGGLREADLEQLVRMAAETEVPERLVTRIRPMDGYRDFLRGRAARLLEDDALKPLLGLVAIVDTGTAGGTFLADLLEDLGADLDRLASSDAQRMAQAILDYGADMGVRLDPDCSRAYVFDHRGRDLHGNRMIALLSAMLLEKQPGATIVTDSVTSTGLSAFIAEWGGVHYRFKRGYRNVIDEAIRLNDEGIDCPLAIETTGHAAFRENGFLDDGIYLALRLGCEVLDRKREGQTLFSLIDDLEEPVETFRTSLGLLDRDDPAAACQEAAEIILSYTLENPDWQPAPDSREGVRITYNLDGGVNNAWLQLRASMHSPTLQVEIGSNVPGGARRILEQLRGLLGDVESLDVTPVQQALDRMRREPAEQ